MKIDIQYNKEYSYSDILIKNYNIFKEMNVRIKDVTKSIEENKISYTLIVAKQMEAVDVLLELSKYEHISQYKFHNY